MVEKGMEILPDLANLLHLESSYLTDDLSWSVEIQVTIDSIDFQ